MSQLFRRMVMPSDLSGSSGSHQLRAFIRACSELAAPEDRVALTKFEESAVKLGGLKLPELYELALELGLSPKFALDSTASSQSLCYTPVGERMLFVSATLEPNGVVSVALVGENSSTVRVTAERISDALSEAA